MKFIIKKDFIEAKGMMISVNQRNTMQSSYIFCDQIEYVHYKKRGIFDHHIMIFNKDCFVFKAWLPNKSKDKEFKDIHEALQSIGMQIRLPSYVQDKIRKEKK